MQKSVPRRHRVCEQSPYDSHSWRPRTHTWHSIRYSCEQIFAWSRSREHIIRDVELSLVSWFWSASALVQAVKEKLEAKSIYQWMKRCINIKFSHSTYVTGIEIPTSKHMTLQKEVHIPQSTKWYMQIFVASDNFYIPGRSRYEKVMLQPGKATRNGRNFNKLLFAKAPWFVFVQYKPMIRPSSALCMVHNNEDCGICTTHIDEKYMFVQYYNTVPEKDVSVDGVDGKFKCIRLKWERSGEAYHDWEQGKVFDLWPLDSVRGRAHVISSNSLVHLLHDTVPYKKTPRENLKYTTDWQNEIFYVNRFFHNEDYQLNVEHWCNLWWNTIKKYITELYVPLVCISTEGLRST